MVRPSFFFGAAGVLAVIGVVACGDDATGGGGSGAAGGTGSGAGPVGGAGDCGSHTTSTEPDFSSPPGRFTLRAEPEFATFDGSVLSSAPIDFHVESERSGLCRLLTYTPSNCTPACDPTELCIDSQCVAQPTVIDAGNLVIDDFQSAPIQVSGTDGIYYWSSDPSYLPGSRARLVASGGDAGAFDLEACVPDAVSPTSDWSALLAARQPGEDVVLAWSNPRAGARIYLRMTTGIGTHGGISPVEVECEGPDMGMLTLPGDYLDALYAQGWSCGRCGDNQLKRYFSAETTTPSGVVRFRAEAWTGFFFIP
ncbi:MAG: hypothetical protein U0271_28145 [Polyangiaceae bacterium]